MESGIEFMFRSPFCPNLPVHPLPPTYPETLRLHSTRTHHIQLGHITFNSDTLHSTRTHHIQLGHITFLFGPINFRPKYTLSDNPTFAGPGNTNKYRIKPQATVFLSTFHDEFPG